MQNKICPICNLEFETNIPNQIYCSAYCRNKRTTLKYEINKEFHKICECCGKEFVSKSNAKYCSDECREIKFNEYNNRVYKKHCKYCNKFFETKNNSKIYCSEKCRTTDSKKNKEKKKNKSRYISIKKKSKLKKKNKTIYIKTCKSCNKEFSSTSNKQYCSEKCRINKRKEIKKRICKTCGKEFISASYKKYCSEECIVSNNKTCPICGEKFYTKNRRKYCSEECKNVGIKYSNKKSQTELDLSKNNDSIRLMFNGRPINTWHISGFTEELKNKILERDGYKCYICRKETNLHVHHIIPRDEGGPHIPENLITLCGSCHRSVEAGNVDKIIKKCKKSLKKLPKGIHKIT